VNHYGCDFCFCCVFGGKDLDFCCCCQCCFFAEKDSSFFFVAKGFCVEEKDFFCVARCFFFSVNQKHFDFGYDFFLSICFVWDLH